MKKLSTSIVAAFVVVACSAPAFAASTASKAMQKKRYQQMAQCLIEKNFKQSSSTSGCEPGDHFGFNPTTGRLATCDYFKEEGGEDYTRYVAAHDSCAVQVKGTKVLVNK